MSIYCAPIAVLRVIGDCRLGITIRLVHGSISVGLLFELRIRPLGRDMIANVCTANRYLMLQFRVRLILPMVLLVEDVSDSACRGRSIGAEGK